MKQLASRFKYTYRYINNALSLNVTEVPRSDAACLTWDQRHDREQQISAYYPDSLGRSTSHSRLRQNRRFQFPYHNLPILEQQYSNFARCVLISQFMQYHNPHVNVLFWGQAALKLAYPIGMRHGTPETSKRTLHCRYMDPLPRMLNDFLKHDCMQWHPPQIRLHQFMTFRTKVLSVFSLCI